MNQKTDKPKREAICPFCEANLLESGIVEVLECANTRTPITFTDNRSQTGETLAENINDQWIACGACGADIITTTAMQVIDFAIGESAYIPDLITKIGGV